MTDKGRYMKTAELEHAAAESLLARLEATVGMKMKTLFARCPTLYGFSVQDRAMLPKEVDRNRIPDADLFITEIGVFPKLDSRYDEIHDEITLAISDLVQDQPHAYDYLRARMFARTLQSRASTLP